MYYCLIEMMIAQRLTVGLVCVSLLASMGCGKGSSGQTAHLSGSVTLDGKPLPADAQASITFQPTKGNKGRAIAVPIVNGQYDSPDTPLGSVSAILNLNIPTGKMVMSERMGGEVPEIETVTLSSNEAGGIKLDITEDKSDQGFAVTRAK